MKYRMSKLERVSAALKGEKVDRPPFSIWYHFGDQHLDGKAHAEIQVNFYRHYELDFLKVMYDYEFPRPENLYDIEHKQDWERLATYNPWERREFREQIIAIKEISRKIGSEAYIITTIFSPWTVARNIAYKVFEEHLTKFPEQVLHGLDIITTNLERFAAATIEAGANGIFYSVAGATKDLMTWENYEKFGKPFDLRILHASEGAPFNVLHIHGSNVYFEELLNYPVSAINWADRDKTNPSLKQARKLTTTCLMGGIEHLSFKETYLKDVEWQILDAVEQTTGTGLIVAPGCSVKTNTYEYQIRNIHSVLESLVTGKSTGL